MILRVRLGPVFAVALCLVVCAYGANDKATAPPTPSAPTAADHARYPDEALLSNYRYASSYFGFTIDLPADAGLRPIPVPVPADGSIPLLATIGHVPEKAVLEIVAYKADNKPGQPRALLRRELDNELSIGVEELHGLSKTSVGGQSVFFFETRRGVDQHSVYAAELNGYVIHIFAGCRDEKLLKQLQSAVARMRFFPPASISEYAGVGAAPYNGPAVPYRVLQELKANPPGRQLEAGQLKGNVYENHQLGFAYELPKGWHFKSEAAVMPALERSRQQSTGQPALGPNERLMREACERTLVSAWRTLPSDGDIQYDDFGEVTLFATPLACFPNAKFPDMLADKEPLRDFLVAYGESHPIVHDMKGARAFTREGRTFIVMDGVIAYQEAGEALSRRVSVALALTHQRDYLLAFFFAAPHEAELRELANARVAFDPEPALKQAKASESISTQPQPGGSVEGHANGSGSAAAANASTESASDSKPAETKQPANLSASPATDSPAQPAASRPSLLKPGETMQDQQMKGASVPGRPSK
jgi:hypothetical protein